MASAGNWVVPSVEGGVVAYADPGVGVVGLGVIGGLKAAPYVYSSDASGAYVSADLYGMGPATAGECGYL